MTAIGCKICTKNVLFDQTREKKEKRKKQNDVRIVVQGEKQLISSDARIPSTTQKEQDKGKRIKERKKREEEGTIAKLASEFPQDCNESYT